MPVEVACPGCGVRLKAPEEKLGKKARCSKCGAAFRLTARVPNDSVDPDRVPMAEAVEDLDPPPAPPPQAPAKQPQSRPSEATPVPPARKVKPAAPEPEVLSFDDDPTPLPASPSGSKDPFSFSAPAPALKVESKGKQKALPLQAEASKPAAAPKVQPVPDGAVDPPARRYVPPGQQNSSKPLMLAGVIGLIAVGACVAAVVVSMKNNQEPQQVKSADPKDAPVPAVENESKVDFAKVAMKVEKGPDRPEPKPVPNPKSQTAPGPVKFVLPPNAKAFQVSDPAAGAKPIQPPVGVAIKIDVPVEKVKRFFAPAKRIDQDATVVWQSVAGLNGRGEKLTVDSYSGSTGARVGRFEIDGDGRDVKCDVSADGKLFAAGGPEGRVTVWTLADKAKVLDGFDPYADKPDHKKAGLAAVFFPANAKNLVAVSTAGAVHLFEIATKKTLGEFVPAGGEPGRVAVGTSVAADEARGSVVVAVGGAVHQITITAPLKLAWKLDLGGELGRPLGVATAGTPGKFALAFETEASSKKERGLLVCLPNEAPVLFRWPDKAGEPTGVEWVGTAFAVVSTTRGAVWVESEGGAFAPLAYATTPGAKSLHGSTELAHWYLIPNPAEPTKSLLLELNMPPEGLLDYRSAAEAKQPLPGLRLDAKGLSR